MTETFPSSKAKELERSDETLDSFVYNPKQQRLLIVGNEDKGFVATLDKLGYPVTVIRDSENIGEQLKTNTFQLVIVYQNEKNEKQIQAIVSSIKEIDDNLFIALILKEGTEISSSLRSQVLDSIEEYLPFAIIISRMEAVLKNKLMKAHLKKLLVIRQEVLQEADEVYQQLVLQEDKLGEVVDNVKKLEKEHNDVLERNKELTEKIESLENERRNKQQKIHTLMEQITELTTADEKDIGKISKDEDIELIKRKITDAFESPIQKLTRDIAKLTRLDYQSLDREEIKQTLSELIKSLGNSELYRPTFEKLFSVVDLDETTKTWISNQFCREKDMREESDKKEESTERESEKSFHVESPTTVDSENLTKLSTFEFMPLDLKTPQLLELWEFMFADLGFVQKFHIKQDTLKRFLNKVVSLYRQNLYHSLFHAFDVSQTVYAILKTNVFDDFITPLDKFAVFTASICHDLDHPGVSNQFLINSQNELAITYNDKSVLENHHAYLTFNILTNSELNIISSLSAHEYKTFRRIVIATILSTDMSVHFELISKFSTRIESATNDSKEQSRKPSFSINEPKDRELICNTILHAADISNAAKPWPIAKRWADLVFEEFMKQGDQEKKLGLPVSPFMDRTNTDKVKLNQNFSNFMVKPLFAAMAQFSPCFERLLDNMTKNAKEWEALTSEEKKAV